MYVRLVSVAGDPTKIDDTVEQLTAEGQNLPAEQPGFRGLGIFVDREGGKLLVSTWWESEEVLRASEEALRERRGPLLAPFALTMTIETFEAAVVRRSKRRPGPGAGIRVNRLEFAPSDAHQLVESFQNTVLPRIETNPGFGGAALLIDRAAGHAVLGAGYTDPQALAISRMAARAVRADTLKQARLTWHDPEEFEVVTPLNGLG
ncbi:MAG TPA: antibiotic biosynthesis monooxygenase [Streptosporangiaceae bacterium]|jgi:heme-degrading monooxygenase HmoA|nr:antibiotic biosynthesis monooxygenase [Streptosporangiaceae bacterium]